jgi:hypothetical protein
LSIIFGGVIVLCKMVLRRNHYIIQIEDWILGNIKEVKKDSKGKK